MVRTRQRWFAAILVAYLALAATYSLVVPLWEAPDEPEHYQYILYLRTARALPSAPLPTVQVSGNEESNQAPLYYLAGALATFWAGDRAPLIRLNPYFTWGPGATRDAYVIHTADEEFPWPASVAAARLVRLLSVLLGAVTVWGAYRIASDLFPDSLWPAIAAAGLTAFRPGFLASAGTINNDNAVAAFGALTCVALIRIWRRGPAPGRLALAGALFGLTVLAKENGLTLAPIVLLWPAAVAWRCGRGRWDRARRAVAAAAIVGGTAAVVAGWWFVRNLVISGYLIRKEYTETAPIGSLAPWRIAEAAGGYLHTFWGTFGWQRIVLPDPAYFVFTAGAALAWLGFALAVYRRRREPVGWPMIGLAVAIGVTVLAADAQRQLTGKLGTDHARFWLPAAAPLGVVLGLGLVEWAGWLDRRRLPAPILAGLAVFAVIAPFAYARPAFPDPFPLRADVRDWPIDRPVRADFGTLELAGTSLPGLARIGDRLSLKLYWVARAPEPADLTVFVHLIDRAGRLIAQDDGPIGTALFPNGRWQPGDTVATDRTLVLPPDLPDGEYDLIAGLYPAGHPGDRRPIAGGPGRLGDTAVPLGVIRVRPRTGE